MKDLLLTSHCAYLSLAYANQENILHYRLSNIIFFTFEGGEALLLICPVRTPETLR